MTETWAHEEINNAHFTLDGYEIQPDLRKDREDTAQGRGGGILVYTRVGLSVIKLDNVCNFTQYCSFKLNDVTFYLIYRSPNAPQESIDNLATLLRTTNKNSIFIGDFNLPEVDWGTGRAPARLGCITAAADDLFLTQLVDFPTQVRGNTLDLVLTNMPERISNIVGAGRLGASDHEMLKVTIQCNNSKEVIKEVFNWRRAKWDEMRAELGKVNWSREFRGQRPSKMWKTFKSRVHAAVKKHVPKKKILKSGRPPWMTRELLAAVRKKHRMWQDTKRGADVEEYKREDKRVKNLIKKAKNKYERKLAENGGNNRPFYAYVKRKSKSRPEVGPLRAESGETVADAEKMAGILNNYFSSVFTKESPTAPPPASDLNHGGEIRTVPISAYEVKKKIKNLRPHAAAGPDEIGPRLLQELSEELARPLAWIFRDSLSTGDVPEDWRRANVTPIYKKGPKADAANYRPVSLTSVCCKLMESIIKDKITHHLESKDLLNPSQHGFRSGRSCCTNLIEFMDRVTAAADAGEPMDVVFLDFAKAFDKVPHKRLGEKLRAHGVGGDLWRWIQNWLSNRQQRVVLNGRSSSWKEVLSGVPQGSVLGPLLFLVFINDLDGAAPGIDILRKFADDTKLGHQVKTDRGCGELQEALNQLCEWANLWGMEFNVSKCKVMHIGRNNPKHQYYMKGQPLVTTEEEKDVGVKMMSNLKPTAQCAAAAKTAKLVLSQIGRSFHYRDRHIFVKLYKQYVRPHLEFATPAWSPWTEGDRGCLEDVQRQAVRMISGLRSETYEGKLLELGLTTLEERRHQTDMLQVHKILNGRDKVLCAFELAAAGGRATRMAADPLNIKIPMARLDIRKHFFTGRTPNLWNAIPADIKQARTTTSFKHLYRKYRSDAPGAAR